MRIDIRVPTFEFADDPKVLRHNLTNFARTVGEQMLLLSQIINGQQTLGDAIENDNTAGVWRDCFTGSPGVEITVNHDLGVIPVGFFLIIPPHNGYINRGTTPWTETQIFLTGSAPTESFRIFILPPPKKEL